MSYEVLARRWRPPTFDDVVGQPLVTTTLKNAIGSGKIAHAFLFSGVRGVGKTTTARILAKALNCTEGPTVAPCNQCVSCIEIAESRSVDVQEIDAASNTGVDNIREIRESVRYGTARDRFKIFIIDEVHMLSKGAFNALLKTLEEPPSHVKFILATTELNKIPDTIKSRCQEYVFRPLSFTTILERLQLICREEGVTLSEFGMRAVASVARGSMRDAQSTLDKMIALAGQEISDDDVRTLLGLVDEEILFTLVEAVASEDLPGLLLVVRDLSDSGIDPQNFCQMLMVHIRNLLVCRLAGWNDRLLNLPESEQGRMLAQAERFTDLDLIRFYDLLNRVAFELRTHAEPFLHLEMALVKLVELSRLPTIEEVIGELKSGAATERVTTPLTAENRPAEVRRLKPVSPQVTVSGPAPSAAAEKAPVARSGDLPDELVVGRLMDELKRDHPGMHSLLNHSSGLQFQAGRLHVAFPSSESSFYSLVSTPEKKKLLEDTGARLSGSPVIVELTLLPKEGGDRPADPAEDPAVQKFLKVFPGKISVTKKVEN